MRPHRHLHQEAGPRGPHRPVPCHRRTESRDGATEGRSSWGSRRRKAGARAVPSSDTVNCLLATALVADMLARCTNVAPGVKAIFTQSTSQRLSLERSSVQVSVCFWVGFVLCPCPPLMRPTAAVRTQPPPRGGGKLKASRVKQVLAVRSPREDALLRCPCPPRTAARAPRLRRESPPVILHPM